MVMRRGSCGDPAGFTSLSRSSSRSSFIRQLSQHSKGERVTKSATYGVRVSYTGIYLAL
jgi:hypothetical protein